jgi:hypothetical protein
MTIESTQLDRHSFLNRVSKRNIEIEGQIMSARLQLSMCALSHEILRRSEEMLRRCSRLRIPRDANVLKPRFVRLHEFHRSWLSIMELEFRNMQVGFLAQYLLVVLSIRSTLATSFIDIIEGSILSKSSSIFQRDPDSHLSPKHVRECILPPREAASNILESKIHGESWNSNCCVYNLSKPISKIL